MKNVFVTLMVLSLLVCAAGVGASTYTWSQASGPHVWSGDFWGASGAYPNAVDDVANISVSSSANPLINIDQNFTVGTLNIKQYAGQTGYFLAPSGTPAGKLTFQVSSGSATLTDISGTHSSYYTEALESNLVLNSPLVVNVTNNSEWGFDGRSINSDLSGLNLSGVISGANGITKTGTGMFMLAGVNAGGNASPNSAGTPVSNTFTGPVNIQAGYVYVNSMADGGSMGANSNALTLGSAGYLGHLVLAVNTTTTGQVLTRPINLTGEGGALQEDSLAFTLGTGASITGNGMLLVGASTGANNNPIFGILFNNAADNSYVGDTRVEAQNVAVNVLNRIFTGNVEVEFWGELHLKAATNVGGSILVGSIKNPAGATFSVLATLGLTSATMAMPTLDPNSSGILSIECTSGLGINSALAAGAAQLGNGYMAYAGIGGTFTGATLQPNLDNVYRFTNNTAVNSGSQWLTLDHPGDAVGALQDVGGVPCSVEVNQTANEAGGFVGGILLNDANTFTGGITVNVDALLRGVGQASGSPFGSPTGNVYLNGGALQLFQGAGATATSKGDVYPQGLAEICLNAPNYVTSLTVNSINRTNGGVLGIYNTGYTGVTSRLGVNEQLYVNPTNAPTVTPTNGGNGMVAPWMVDFNGQYFLSYNSTQGFVPATFTVTGPATGGGAFASIATDVVNLPSGATVATGGQSAYAVRTAGNLLSAASGDILAIGSGGLIVNAAGGTCSANIAFGGQEGIIYYNGFGASPSTGWNFSGAMTGTNGLTISTDINNGDRNYISPIFLTGNYSGLSGTLTVNSGRVLLGVNSDGTSVLSNPIYINNGEPSSNTYYDATASIGPALTNTKALILNQTITIGPNGGTIEDFTTVQNTPNPTVTINGQITGTGCVTFWGNTNWRYAFGPILVANTSATTPNNWSGGTIIFGEDVDVKSGSCLGTGPVTIGTDGTLVLLGPTNIYSNARVSVVPNYAADNGIRVECASATWGSLEGSGSVFLNGTNSGTGAIVQDSNGWVTGGGACTLTFGQNNLSTVFSGRINDNSLWNAASVGSVAKIGSGTFNLIGYMAVAGTVDVSDATGSNTGTLTVTGALTSPVAAAGNVSINAGGTINGTGLITHPVFVAGGTLGGSLTINNDVTLTTGSINAGGVINGNLVANAGTVAGTTAVNGNVIVAGATVTGTHAISGNVAVSSGSFTAGAGTTIGSLNVTATGAFAGASSIAGAVQMDAGTIMGAHAIGGNYTQNGGALSGTDTFGTTLAPVAVTINDSTFSGNHTINGTFTTSAGSNAVVATHNGTTAGTLTIVGTTTLDHSTVLNFNLGPAGTTGGNVNDFINITGDLSLDGTLNVNNLAGFATGTYTLIDYTGSLTGAGLTLGTTPTGFNYSLNTDTANEIELVVKPFLIPGDTNLDGVVNSLDIDAIYQHMTVLPPGFTGWSNPGGGGEGGDQPWPRIQSAYQAQYDVNGDQAVSQDDVTYELRYYFLTSYGDADLNKATDFQDFQALLDHWQNSGAGIGWAQADFNGDGVVDFLDFQNLLDYWNPSGWNFAPTQTPEPASLSLILLGGLALLRRNRK